MTKILFESPLVLSILRLHDLFELIKTTRNYLILLVGPLGLEPRTNGL
ncbi:hypothetical protein [Legionella sp. WA2022007384]